MSTPTATIPLMVHGERLSRDEFERRYEQMPDVRAELLDGVVYIMSSPVSLRHANPHGDLLSWLAIYRLHTPGCLLPIDATLRLDSSSEPQPDAMMYLEEEYGGSSRETSEGYLEGRVEFVAEIALSTLDFDLNVKLPMYRRNGVQEYLLLRVEDGTLDWYVLNQGGYQRLQPGADGILRSEIFPGLWLDPEALLNFNPQRVMQVSLQGISSPEYANFVQQLQSRRTTR